MGILSVIGIIVAVCIAAFVVFVVWVAKCTLPSEAALRLFLQ